MSPCRSIAILGATGNFGEQLLAALSHHPRAKSLDIRILARPSPWQIPIEPGLNISLFQITYNTRGTHASLVEALSGVDVVISAVGDDSGLTSREVKNSGALPGFRAQDEVATAAKAAGVKLFVPSEYGYPTHTLPDNSPAFIVGKKHHLNLLKSLNLPWLVVYAGTFPRVEPFPSPLSSCNESTPKGPPPYETTRYHVASYVLRLVLDGDFENVKWGLHRILGTRRDKLLITDSRERWVVDTS